MGALRLTQKTCFIISAALSIFTVAWAGTPLIGWHFFIPALIKLPPSYLPLAYNTTLCFVLLGIGLLVTLTNYRIIAIILSICVLMLASATLIEFYGGINLHISELVFKYKDVYQFRYSTHIAPNTAYCFILLGAALLINQVFLSKNVKFIVSSILGLLAFCFSILFITGHFIPLQSTYQWSTITPMNLNAAIGIGILSLAFMLHTFSKAETIEKKIMMLFPVILWFCLSFVSLFLWRAMIEEEFIQGFSVKVSSITLVAGLVIIGVLVLAIYFLIALIQRNRELKNSLSTIQATLEASPDAIIVADNNNNTICYNQHFKELYRSDKSTDALPIPSLKSFANLLADQNDLFHVLKSLSANPLQEAIAEIRLKDNRILELTSAPQLISKNSIGHVWCFHDITDRKNLEDKLLHQSTHDHLTNLPNRLFLLEYLEQAIEHAKENNLFVAVMYLDLDRFKFINDSLGHDIGDELLNEVAKRFISNIEEPQIIGRLGGDEFVFILPSVKRIGMVSHIAQTFLNLLQQEYTINNRSFKLKGSIGISLYPKDGTTPSTLLKNADLAMYRAKATGGQQFHFFTEIMHVEMMKRLKLEQALYQAVQNDELTLFYQPLYDLQTRKICGIEALIRWQYPKGQLTMPEIFVPIAEEIGLIHKIGRWALATACQTNRNWHSTGRLSVPVAVNVSAHQFNQDHFVDLIAEVLKKTQLPSELLELEITESALMLNPNKAVGKFSQLHKLGVQIAIDDFGKGYSSLSYLKEFPINKLKIDQSFIHNLSDSSNNLAILNSILVLGKELNLKVVAEGIEKESQAKILQEIGCEIGQGFYLSPPLNLTEINRLLEE